MAYRAELDHYGTLLLRRDITREQFVEHCLRIACSVIDCSATQLGLFVETHQGRTLRCLGSFDRKNGALATTADQHEGRVGPFFQQIEASGFVLAHDAATDTTTREFIRGFQPLDVRSLMATAFSLNGKLYGAFICLELDEAIVWSCAQLDKLKIIDRIATLALASASDTNLDSLWGSL